MKDNILEQIKAVYGGRESGDKLRKVTCPSCLKKEAFVYLDKPMAILCPRRNKCGDISKARDLFPDLFEIEKNYPATKEDPSAPAKAFLESRGLKHMPDIKYSYKANVTRGGKNVGGGVFFDLGDNVQTGRLFNPPKGEGKTHHIGKVNGKIWGLEYIKNKTGEVYLVEGIIDALSLMEKGCQAIAYLASGYTPKLPEDLVDCKLIIGCDNDKAGLAAGHRLVKHFKDLGYESVKLSIPHKDRDYNDLLVTGELTRINMGDFLIAGSLAQTGSGLEYTELYYKIHKDSPYLFEHIGCTFYGTAEIKKTDEVQIDCQMVANFTIRLSKMFIQLDDLNREQTLRELTIDGRNGICKIEVLAHEFCAIARAKETIAAYTRNYTYAPPTGIIHDKFFAYICNQKPDMIVRDMPSYGVDVKTGAFITPKYFLYNGSGGAAVDGVCKIGKEYIRGYNPVDQCVMPDKCKPKQLFSLLNECYPYHFVSLLGWWCGILHWRKFIDKYKFFPNASLFGEPGSGKTSLTLRLMQMSGLDAEGTPISKSHATVKGFMRKLSQYSGVPFAVLEGNDREQNVISPEALLTGYNGGSLTTRASKSNNNTTNCDSLSTALLFCQNREPFKSMAAKERVISMEFSKGNFKKTQKHFNELELVSPAEMCGLGANVIRSNSFEDGCKYFEEYRKELTNVLGSQRLAGNHAVPLAFAQSVSEKLGLEYDKHKLKRFIIQCALTKIQSSSRPDESILDIFFEELREAVEEKVDYVKYDEQTECYQVRMRMFFGGFSKLLHKEVREKLNEHSLLLPSGTGRFNVNGHEIPASCNIIRDIAKAKEKIAAPTI